MLVAEKEAATDKTYFITDGQAYTPRRIYKSMCTVLVKSAPKSSVPAVLIKPTISDRYNPAVA